MEAGTAKMHEAARAAGQAQLTIGSEVHAATAEGSSSLMQRKVDQLTLELGRHLGEEQKIRAQRQRDDQDVAQLHAKINAIDGAAADLIKMLEAAITKSNVPVDEGSKKKEVTRLTKDVTVAASKAAQLAKLSVTANKKVADAKANLNKAKDKKAAAKAYLAAKKDAAAVKAAAKKVDTMEANDKAKIAAVKVDTTDTEKAVAAFAKRLKEKMVRITQLGNKATPISNSAGNAGAAGTLVPAKEKEYHDRITALEAAVAQFGGVEQVALVEKQKPGSNATAAIDKLKQKLSSAEAKIGGLQKEYTKAEEADDHDTMIKVGTEMKDMEEEATTIREKLKATYGVVIAPSSVDHLSDANSTVASLESVKKKFQAAVATAKEASKKRAKLMKAEADARLKFNKAARVEHKKIEEANKAKAGLAAQMSALKKKEHAEKGRVDAMKMKLNAEAAALAKQEKDAAAKREMVKKKLVETEKEYSKNVGHLQSADTDAKVAVNVASKTLVGDFDEKTRAAAVGATAPAANTTRLR
jgi:chromosome segregation ATPase